MPNHRSAFVKGTFFLTIWIVSKVLNAQLRILADSLDLEFLLLKPLPTDINLRSLILADAAREYCSTARYPVLIPSAPIV